MTHIQRKQKNYSKFTQQLWLSVEREISSFQKKVIESMIQLGDMNKKNMIDFELQPVYEDDVILGQQFYLQLIRPLCVNKGYLPKQIPQYEQIKDIHFDQQDQKEQYRKKKEIKQNLKDKKQNKKNIKNKHGKKYINQEIMKIKIVKQNFLKDIQLVVKSHSTQRLQIDFNLKHKKLEVKLITFFYIAFYYKKYKIIKKIDDSQIFELINIMIKIVRIYSKLQGRCFSDPNKLIQVSSTLIKDLKSCIKGLKQFYNYNNKKIIINYPKLIYYTSYDKYFPTLDIKPYPSQIQFIQAFKSALDGKGNVTKPTLILYKTMIGSGKTSTSIALSQLIKQCKILNQQNQKLQILYTCMVSSVRAQVGRYAYNKKQNFAVAAYDYYVDRTNQWYPRIINSWSCRFHEFVDLLITDPFCAFDMLNHQPLTKQQLQLLSIEHKKRKRIVRYGKLDRENILLFIDEPTAFCKNIESIETRKIFDILANYPPKVTVLASATMPDRKDLEKTIKLIERCNPNLNVIQIESKQFKIGCQYCSFKGQVIFPHTGIKNKKQLIHIKQLLLKNPFLLRLYTGPSLFFFLRKCQKYGIENLPNIQYLHQVKQDDITKATFKILNILQYQCDQLIQQICSMTKDENIMQFKQDINKQSDDDLDQYLNIEQQQENKIKQEIFNKNQTQQQQDYINFTKMLKSDACKFLGGCLIATANPLEFTKVMFKNWVNKIKPVKKLFQKYQKDYQDLLKQIRLLQDDKQMRQEKKTQKITNLQNQKQPKLDFPQYKKINTIQHYNRYCKEKSPVHQSMLIKPIPIEDVGEELIQEIEDFFLKLLFCGVAVYPQSGVSSKYLDKVEQLASRNFLAFIITDQSLCYGTNFPISNVILRDSLATKLNMNQLFQLIGRAGRVGQSWTARAFLQEKALQKLNDYIHKPQCQISDEGLIFQQIAEEKLNNPELYLRSSRTQVRYQDEGQTGEQIQIIIKKKQPQNPHIINKVVLVLNQGDKFFTCKRNYPSIKYYDFPNTPLLYSDLPTTKENILNISLYYQKQSTFMSQIINNAGERLLKQFTSLNNLEKNNKFQPKNYEQYYNLTQQTYIILMQCKQTPKMAKNYEFQYLLRNDFDQDELLLKRIHQVMDQANRLYNEIITSDYYKMTSNFKILLENNTELLERFSIPFYREMYNDYLLIAEEEYQQMTDHITNKQLLDMKNQCVIILTIYKIRDLRNIYNEYFHINKYVRPLWQKLLTMTMIKK